MKFCVYHSVDLDGECSAAIMKHFHPSIELIPYNYDQKFPWERITSKDTVFFCDVVIQPYEDMLKMFKLIGNNLYIIDHHKSFMESPTLILLNTLIPDNLCIDPSLAACELTWQFLCSYCQMSLPMPIVVELLGKYDSWRHESDWESVVLPFQYGMRIRNTNPLDPENVLNSLLTTTHFNNVIISTVEKGKTILAYETKTNCRVASSGAFDYEIEGFKCLCVNGTTKNSHLLSSKWDEDKYDFMVVFCLTRELKWSVSFYTTRKDRDASMLAAKFGGGGHRGAAGATVASLEDVWHGMDKGVGFKEDVALDVWLSSANLNVREGVSMDTTQPQIKKDLVVTVTRYSPF